MNGNIMLCQVRNQQSNLIGDFVSENFINSYNELDYFTEREREREQNEVYEVSDEYLQPFILSDKLQNTILQRGKPNLEVAKTILSTSWKYHYASIDNYVSYDNDRIRRLTPRECLRLMGFSDNFKIVVSNTQAYRQSGNSIVVNVFEHLLPKIFQAVKFDTISSNGDDATAPPNSHDGFTSPNLSLTLLRSLTISNEYVYSKHKHGISETHGQSKIKFTKREFSEIFGNQLKGRIHFNKKATANFLNNLKTRWEKMEKTDLENHKDPNLDFIAKKITDI